MKQGDKKTKKIESKETNKIYMKQRLLVYNNYDNCPLGCGTFIRKKSRFVIVHQH